MNFIAVAETTVTVASAQVVAYEITNLTGRVIARTVNASEANRAGAVRHAKKNMGGAYGIDANGNRVHLVTAD